MAKNFVQPGCVVTVTTPAAGLTSGQGYMTGNLFGIAQLTSVSGDDNEIQTDGVHDIDKDDASYSVGDAVYWDDQNSKATDASFSAGLTRIGVAIKAAATTDSTVRCRLDGMVTRQTQL